MNGSQVKSTNQNALAIMAAAGVPLEDARWYHCIATRRGIHGEKDVMRMRTIKTLITESLDHAVTLH